MMSLEDLTQAIHTRLSSLIPEEKSEVFILHNASRYSLLSSGKRLRPLITLVILHDLGIDVSRGLNAACAIELIHTYSLIHDDLPCMDNDDLRRNQPSLHIAFDEGLALLTGDFLLTLAFEILSLEHLLSHEIRLKLIQCLSFSAGKKGMIGGQVLDILKKKQKHLLDKHAIDTIHQGKTGALFTASFLFAGIIANLSIHEKEMLKTLSMYFGKAFQYMDDVQDYITKKDEYINIVSILGKDKTIEEIYGFEKKIMDLLETFSHPLPLLKQLLRKNFTMFHESSTHLLR